MNENNFDYLNKQIFYKGFGSDHGDTLKQKMNEGKPDFMLTHQQDFGKDNTVATLHFRKSEKTDMYFFNNYNLVLKTAGQNDPIKQTFYINSDPSKKEQEDVTLKEGYNLLSGRAVNKNQISKEGTSYNAWVQLDFKSTDKHGNFEEKKYHQNYGFDLEQALSKHPIKELTDPTNRERLLDSLKRGNRQSVTMAFNGKEQKVFIEAAPQYKGINFYDTDLKRVNLQDLYTGKETTQAEGRQSNKKQSAKQDAAGDDEGDGTTQTQKSGKRKSRGQGIA